MTEATEALYRKWRQLTEKEYGDSVTSMERLDARIRRAKARYDEALAEEAKVQRIWREHLAGPVRA